MFRARQILVRTIVLAVSTAAFAACGQRGPLYLPTDPAAAQRATLPETLNPAASRAPASRAPASSPADSASTTRP
ncbi:lipoprotein [Diaphorobacter sp.]|uniref:LPS translocon maturation chaperone LptM n=1 Tax=Diaphorobacter sp. TaxID=1934310 RepID=UPI00258B76B4|nr:lipoprotein [Diaphorobacter sp.]